MSGETAPEAAPAGIELLRRSRLFAELPEDDLERLYAGARPLDVTAGELLMREGTRGDALYVVLEGEFEVFKGSGPDAVPVATLGTGDVVGEMALLEHGARTASVRAVTDGRVLRVDEEVVGELIRSKPSAALAIVRTATSRLRATEAMLQQREKLAALGTMAAGLAHELNNPAAAARRSTDLLHEALDAWERAAGDLAMLPSDTARTATIESLRDELGWRSEAREAVDPLTLSDREGAVEGLLEQRGVGEAWELAQPLAALGWDAAALEALAARAPGDAFGALARWLGRGAAVHLLLAEMATSVERISEIVKAVKTYAYLDQAPIQEVDVHEGLENTLVILRHKLKLGVRVTKRYAADLPRIEAYASELNQVWTNIIDNAIDAMDGQGGLTITTSLNLDGGVGVELCDTGPGILPDVQKHIFEPFFTTKPPGVGSGLGMHIVYNIVQRHHGRITLRSHPGETCFEVTLPPRLRQA